MDINAILHRLERLKQKEKESQRDFIDGTNDLKNEIFNLYETIYKRPYPRTNCSSCFQDCYFMFLRNLTLNEIKKMSELVYKLKGGVLLLGFPHGDSSKNCNRHTLTNELAEWHLKNKPGSEIYFETLPDDWKTRIGLIPEEPKPIEVTGVEYEETPKPAKKKRQELMSEASRLQKEGKISKDIQLFKLKGDALSDLIAKVV